MGNPILRTAKMPSHTDSSFAFVGSVQIKLTLKKNRPKWEHSLQGGDIHRGSLPPVRERLRTLAATWHSERHEEKHQVTQTDYDSSSRTIQRTRKLKTSL